MIMMDVVISFQLYILPWCLYHQCFAAAGGGAKSRRLNCEARRKDGKVAFG